MKDIFSKNIARQYNYKTEKILCDRIKKNKYVGSKNTVVLYNYFIENISLVNLIYHKLIDKFLKKLLMKIMF